MNITAALLAGLVLLLPGITALVTWNLQGSTQGAKRPDLQLTSVSALFVSLGIALLMHILGYGLAELIRAAALELGRQLTPVGPVIANPYDMLASVSDGKGPPTAGAVEAFLMLTIFECILAWRLISSTGLDLVLDSVDLRSQGWVFQHVVRPQRHGYTPVAYVLTSATHGEYGIGYEGTVADIRQGENGELKSIALAEPQRFIYEIITRGDSDRRLPKLKTYNREWVGEMVSLDGAAILNIVINNVSKALIAELEESDGNTENVFDDQSPEGQVVDDC